MADQLAIERAAKAIARMVPCPDGGRWNPGHGHDFPRDYSAAEAQLIRSIAATALEATKNDRA